MNNRTKHNHSRVDDEQEIQRQILADDDLQDISNDWFKNARLETGIPIPPASSGNKKSVTMRLDPEVVDYFKDQGRGWQTRINAVLSAFVHGKMHKGLDGS